MALLCIFQSVRRLSLVRDIKSFSPILHTLDRYHTRVGHNLKVVNKRNLDFTASFSRTAQTDNDTESISCWKCGVTVDLNKVLFCDFCEVIQKPKYDADYFEIFGIKKQFNIDPKELTKKFRLLQMQLHPDRFSQKSEEEKKISATYSSLLNQAYKTLGSSLDRGLYLLELQGHPLLDEEEISMEPEFLSEIMEINEEIFEADNKEELQRIKKMNENKMTELFRKVSEEFRNENLDAARECLGRLKYYSKIAETVKELEHIMEK